MKTSAVRKIAVFGWLAMMPLLLQNASLAQYTVTKLVSNQSGKALHTDPYLRNAWGIAFSATQPIWISDNDTGLSTLYNGKGIKQSLTVSIPPAPGHNVGSPTGIVSNGSPDFQITQNMHSGPAFFLFDTLDGTISGWNPTVNANTAVIAIDNSKQQAIYTGLAITHHGPGMNFLYAADSWNNRVDIYDAHFNLVGSFTDPNLPSTFAPYGIQDIGGQLYVTFASTTNIVGGIVDIFTEAGKFVKRFATNGPLNQPWGLAMSPANFGNFSHALLIGNNTPGGTISAFNPSTGKFLGKLKDKSSRVIVIDQLWGMEFGGGSSNNGPTNALFFTAGPNNYVNGLLGVIMP